MASEHIREVTDRNFDQEVLGGDRPALVDFWAAWCGPCRAIAPLIDEIAGEYHDKINVFKLNIDENPEAPARLGIRSIPTLILFKEGQVVDQVVGAVPKGVIEDLLRKASS